MEEVETFTEPNGFKGNGAIVHRLNREAVNNKGKKVSLKVDDFQKTVKLWKDVPVLFGKDHPKDADGNNMLVRGNLARVLAENELRLLGAVKEGKVISEGAPRLEVDFGELINDKGFAKVVKAGKVEVSGGWAPSSEGPIPDHILLFESGLTPPADKGAMFFQEFKEDPKGFFAELFQGAKDFVSKETKAMGELEDLKAQVQAFQNTEKQKAAELLAFQEKVKAVEAEKTEKEKQLNAFQASEKKKALDAAFDLFAFKCPPGWKTGKVKVKDEKGVETEVEAFQELRKDFEKDVQGAYEKLYGHLKKTNTFQEGDGEQHAGGTPPPQRVNTIGVWDDKEKRYNL